MTGRCRRRVLAAMLAGAASMPVAAVAGAIGTAAGLDALGLDATIELRNFSHFHAVAADSAIRDEIRLDLDWQRKLSENIKASIKLRAQADDAGLANDVVIEIPDDRRDRSVLDVAECELAFRLGSSRIYAGRRIYTWGSADVYNPTDRLTSHDWLDPVDGHRRDERIASWSLAATTTVGKVDLEVVWVPFFSPSRLPHLDSRWVGLDEKQFDEQFPELAGNYDTIVDLAHAPAPDANLGNSQVGLRAKTTVAGVDAAISYYDGYFDLPELDLTTFQAFFPRIHVPGLSLSTTFGSFELHSETAVVIGEDRSTGTRVETVNGVDWFLDPLPALHIERALVVLEYLRNDSVAHGSDYTIGIVERADPLLQENGVASRVEVVFSESTSVELDFLLSYHEDPSFYFGPRVIHQFNADMKMEAGFDTFFGDRTTPLGAWTDNSRFYTNLTWSL